MKRLSQQVQALRVDHAGMRGDGARPGMRRLGLLVILTAAAVLGIGWVSVSRPHEQSAMVSGETDGATPTAEPAVVLMASGRITSDHSVVVATKVSGQVVELRIEQGSRVKCGEVLAQLETTEYRTQLDRQTALLHEAEAAHAKARYDFEQTTELRAEQNAAETEWVSMKSALDQSAARVAAARAAVDWAAKQVDDCNIVAPFSGTVLHRYVDLGDYLAAEGGRSGLANGRVVELADTGHLRVDVDVAEHDVARVRDSMACDIYPDAHPDRRYDGHVLWIDPVANFGKGTVGVKVRIDDPDAYTRIGGSARVNFLPG